MSLREKFAGAAGGTRSDYGAVASKAMRTYAHLSPSMASSSKANNRVMDVSSLGDKASTMSRSSHNDINRFTSGISMHHPYKDRGGAFDENKNCYQGDPAARSNFRTPSGGGNGARAGRTMGQTRGPAPYDDIMKENTHPRDPSRGGGAPSGPKGGTVALMNRMKKASVNKMGGGR